MFERVDCWFFFFFCFYIFQKCVNNFIKFCVIATSTWPVSYSDWMLKKKLIHVFKMTASKIDNTTTRRRVVPLPCPFNNKYYSAGYFFEIIFRRKYRLNNLVYYIHQTICRRFRSRVFYKINFFRFIYVQTNNLPKNMRTRCLGTIVQEAKYLVTSL